MTTVETPTLEQAIELVRRLPPSDRAELVALVVRELVSVPVTQQRHLTADQARAAWKQLRESMRDLPKPRLTLGEQLDRDRADRDHALMGRHMEQTDVDA